MCWSIYQEAILKKPQQPAHHLAPQYHSITVSFVNNTVATSCWTPYQVRLLLQQASLAQQPHHLAPQYHSITATQTMEYVSGSSTTTSLFGTNTILQELKLWSMYKEAVLQPAFLA
jgi:hypothetical protein